MIVLVGGEKGGTGKTTLATNLAAIRASAGSDVLLVDTDKQGSASYWTTLRNDVESVPRVASVQKFGKSITGELRDLSTRYSDLIVDAGGRDSIELRAAMVAADCLFIPIQASQFDVWTLAHMNELVEQAQALNERLVAHVVINRASTNPQVTEAHDAENILKDFDSLQFSGVTVCDRIAYRRAASAGLSVVEQKPMDSKAADEILSCYNKVYDE